MIRRSSQSIGLTAEFGAAAMGRIRLKFNATSAISPSPCPALRTCIRPIEKSEMTCVIDRTRRTSNKWQQFRTFIPRHLLDRNTLSWQQFESTIVDVRNYSTKPDEEANRSKPGRRDVPPQPGSTAVADLEIAP
jgi:hypothetical protein